MNFLLRNSVPKSQLAMSPHLCRLRPWWIEVFHFFRIIMMSALSWENTSCAHFMKHMAPGLKRYRSVKSTWLLSMAFICLVKRNQLADPTHMYPTNLDCSSVTLHSPNGRQFPSCYSCARKYQWPWKKLKEFPPVIWAHNALRLNHNAMLFRNSPSYI